MTHEITCLRIIAEYPGQSGIHVKGIVAKSKLPTIAVDRAMSELRKSGFVARSLVSAWTSPGYTITQAGIAALKGSN